MAANDHDRVRYAFYDRETGFIRKVCEGRRDNVVQQGEPGLRFKDVTDEEEHVTPNTHMVDPETFEIMAKELPEEEQRARDLNQSWQDTHTAITDGFVSAALGQQHTYPAQDLDQRNMMMATMVGGDLSCQDGNGAWAPRAHTQAQAIKVLADFTSHRDGHRRRHHSR